MAVGCLVKSLDKTEKILYNIEHPEDAYTSYRDKIQHIQELLNTTELLIGFNLKFDLHWLRRYGVHIPIHLRIWDCQIAHYVKMSQQVFYPSLNEVCNHYNHPQKLDNVKINYWDKGIDTDKVPWDELSSYLDMDLQATEAVYTSQQSDTSINSSKKRLITLQCKDLLTLEEMEWNGLPYDNTKSRALASEIDIKVANIDRELTNLIGSSIPINYASNDDKSVLLYGGSIEVVSSSPYIKKDGSISTSRTIKTSRKYIFPALCKPPHGSGLKKAGYYSTDEGTLKKIRCTGKPKHIISLLLSRAKLLRLGSTYYLGLPNLMESMGWGNVIHGSLNQCATSTGRIASAQPNLQNFPPEVDELFISRYDI